MQIQSSALPLPKASVVGPGVTASENERPPGLADVKRLTYQGNVGPQVHNQADSYSPMFFGVRRDIDPWQCAERNRQAG